MQDLGLPASTAGFEADRRIRRSPRREKNKSTWRRDPGQRVGGRADEDEALDAQAFAHRREPAGWWPEVPRVVPQWYPKLSDQLMVSVSY